MKHGVISNMNSRLIVAIKSSRRNRYAKRKKDIVYPDNFAGGISLAIARYSASAEERETVSCFLAFQETGGSLNKIPSDRLPGYGTNGPA